MIPADPTAEVIDLIRQSMSHVLRTPDITAATTLAQIGALALDIICISCLVEERFVIEFSDQEMKDWRCVADIVASVLAQRREVA